jgi:hypothetical protein
MEDLINDVVEWSGYNQAQIVHNSLFVMTNSFLEWGHVEACRLAGVYIGDNFFSYKNRLGIEKGKITWKKSLVLP